MAEQNNSSLSNVSSTLLKQNNILERTNKNIKGLVAFLVTGRVNDRLTAGRKKFSLLETAREKLPDTPSGGLRGGFSQGLFGNGAGNIGEMLSAGTGFLGLIAGKLLKWGLLTTLAGFLGKKIAGYIFGTEEEMESMELSAEAKKLIDEKKSDFMEGLFTSAALIPVLGFWRGALAGVISYILPDWVKDGIGENITEATAYVAKHLGFNVATDFWNGMDEGTKTTINGTLGSIAAMLVIGGLGKMLIARGMGIPVAAGSIIFGATFNAGIRNGLTEGEALEAAAFDAAGFAIGAVVGMRFGISPLVGGFAGALLMDKVKDMPVPDAATDFGTRFATELSKTITDPFGNFSWELAGIAGAAGFAAGGPAVGLRMAMWAGFLGPAGLEAMFGGKDYTGDSHRGVVTLGAARALPQGFIEANPEIAKTYQNLSDFLPMAADQQQRDLTYKKMQEILGIKDTWLRLQGATNIYNDNGPAEQTEAARIYINSLTQQLQNLINNLEQPRTEMVGPYQSDRPGIKPMFGNKSPILPITSIAATKSFEVQRRMNDLPSGTGSPIIAAPTNVTTIGSNNKSESINLGIQTGTGDANDFVMNRARSH